MPPSKPKPDADDRRGWVRSSNSAECKLWRPDALRSSGGRLIDLSPGGALVRLMQTPLPRVGDAVRLALDPSTPVLTAKSMVRGHVARIAGESEIGIAFERIETELARAA